MKESTFHTDALQELADYDEKWRNRNESSNFPQRHDPEIIKEEKMIEVEDIVRVQVDEIMREELENLKIALDKDKGKKGKKGKGGKKGKKGKGGKKGKKGKKSKDLTADRTPESLYQELIKQGIIKKPDPNTTLNSIVGEYSYLGTTLQSMGKEGQPSIWDIKQAVTLHSILPLGSEQVRNSAPLTKSILIAGPEGCGKRMLIDAICNELGANLFDLTCDNIAGKYPGKSGLNLLLHMVFKLAELFQPSIIFIGNAEQTFYKKVPKTEKHLDPKRLKKNLPKQLKEIKKDKRIMLIGTSNAPFEADIKSFMKVYERLIMMPRPNYGDRRLIWMEYVNKKLTQPECKFIDFSCMAKLTDGFSSKQIIEVIDETLNDRRLNQAKRRAVHQEEFVNHLAKLEPIYAEKEDAFTAWYTKTPIGKKRKKMTQPDDEEE